MLVFKFSKRESKDFLSFRGFAPCEDIWYPDSYNRLKYRYVFTDDDINMLGVTKEMIMRAYNKYKNANKYEKEACKTQFKWIIRTNEMLKNIKKRNGYVDEIYTENLRRRLQ